MKDVVLEYSDCLLCGSKDKELAETIEWMGGHLVYAICQKCGLKYMAQRPTREWYAEFYRNEFWQQSRLHKRSFNADVAGEKNRPWQEEAVVSVEQEKQLVKSRKRQAWRAQRIWSITQPYVQLVPESTVLEIGAGWGRFLELVTQKTKCRAVAIEPSELARQYMEKELGIQLVGRVFEEIDTLESFKGKIDLVVCSHVLENTLDPIDNLKKITALLSPRGVVYIDTCNIYYNNAINPYHPYIFSPETLHGILQAAGLETIFAEHEKHPSEIERITDTDMAKYLAVVAQLGTVRRSFQPPVMPVKSAQEKGEKMMRQTSIKYSSIKEKVRRVFSLYKS